MKELMCAEEARMRVYKDTNIDEAIWDAIVDGINQCVEDGKFAFGYQGYVSPSMELKLRWLGYRVVRVGTSPGVMISWGG